MLKGLERKDFIFAILKYLSVGIGIANNFFRPKFFEEYMTESNFAFLTVYFGIIVYLLFFDGGLGVVIYPTLRNLVVNKQKVEGVLRPIFSLYILLFIIFCLVFIPLLLFWGGRESSFTLPVLGLLGLSAVINTIITYFKSIFQGIDHYVFFENIEIIRKVGNFVMIMLLMVDHSFFSSILFSVSLLSVLLIVVGAFFARNFDLGFRDFLKVKKADFTDLMKSYGKDAFQYFQFSLIEGFLYNFGFILFPVFFPNSDYHIIQFGLWFTIYGGVSILLRVISEVLVNPLTKAYFSKNIALTKKLYIRGLVISTSVCVAIIGGFLLVEEWFFDLWMDGKYRFSWIIIGSLVVFTVGNSGQNIAGKMLVSIGGYFKQMKNISFMITFSLLIAFITSFYLTTNFGLVLLACSSVYFVGALFYVYFAFKQLRNASIQG